MASPGRPSRERQVREQLLEAARYFFLQSPYSEVSTRQIAARADTNVGMIRYYFGNKLGLFEAVLRETLEPMRTLFKQNSRQPTPDSLEQVMTQHVQLHMNNPDFAKLILFGMYCNKEVELQQVIEGVLDELASSSTLMLTKLQQQGLLGSQWDIQLLRLSMMSLLLFPAILPPPLAALHGVDNSEAFYGRLLEHNVRLLTGGLAATGQ